jgi:lipid-binding SYLF domain-containing protein
MQTLRITLTAFCAATLMACSSGYDPDSPERAGDPPSRNRRVQEAIDKFIKADPGMKRFFDDSYGYAIYPKVGKGGLVVGGAHGDGVVYEQGKLIGLSELTQATVGAQLGGQTYAEVIFFRDKGVLTQFQKGEWRAGAQASAVAAKDGASADADYRGGVAIFTVGNEGLMAAASVGGQQYSYAPKLRRYFA